MEGQSEIYLNDFAIENDIVLNGIMRLGQYDNQYGFFILNLDFQTSGTHWVAICRTLNSKYKDCCFYFDSFGYTPPNIFKEIIGDIPCYYSNVELQTLNAKDNNCGIWCLIFIYIMNLFNKPSNDDMNNTIEYMKDINIIW